MVSFRAAVKVMTDVNITDSVTFYLKMHLIFLREYTAVYSGIFISNLTLALERGLFEAKFKKNHFITNCNNINH